MICTFRYFLPLSILLTSCAGDDRGLAPVSGTVFFKGKPLPNAGIIFTPDQDNTRVGLAALTKMGSTNLPLFK
ncbi:MAG: hypothetical protein EBQ87_12535 [Planctomycetes bacterium]|nr:hypothetical protein [Planctomycetota bacterium]